MGMTENCVADEEWEYPPVVAALEAAVLKPIQEYIQRRRVNTPAQVACHPIYELCTEAEMRIGTIR